MPTVVGALDGKHINIQCPKFGGSDHYNYKGFHSTNLMALCDAHYRFLFVDIGSYGRDNDAAVFSRTQLFNMLENGTAQLPPPLNIHEHSLHYSLVGDDIFPLKTWLMKPYRGIQGTNLSEQQAIFSYRLSRARRTIEKAFGILSTRWRIFRRPIVADLDLVDLIVMACVCLHNYLSLTENAKYIPSGFVDSYDTSGELVPGTWRSLPNINRAMGALARQGSNHTGTNPKAVRERLCSYVNSDVGSVPWQTQHVRQDGRNVNLNG